MFVRIVEVTAKPGKAAELSQTVDQKILAALRNQPGFLDAIVLESSEDANCMLALSLWKSKTDADRYQREQFAKMLEIAEDLIQSAPQVRTFNVTQSTIHNISAKVA